MCINIQTINNMNTSFKSLPFDIVLHILSFGQIYYKENYKNRKGKFYKQIEDPIKEAISKIYVPIKFRRSRERFTQHVTCFYERFLGGKYILYVVYDPPYVDSDMDDDYEEVQIDPELSYYTGFCRVSKYSNIGCGIHRMEEHRFDLSKIVYTNL